MAKSNTIELGSLAFDTSQIDPTLAKNYAKLGAWQASIQAKLNDLAPGFDDSKLRAQEARIKAWGTRVSTELAKAMSIPVSVGSGLTIEAAIPGSNAGTIARMQAARASELSRADLAMQSRIGERTARGSFLSEINSAASGGSASGIVAVGKGADVANQHFMRLNRTVSIANTALSATATESSTASRALFQLVGVAEQARVGMLAYGMSTKAAIGSIAIGGGLVAIGAIFEYIARKQDEAIEKWQTLNDKVKETGDRLRSLKDAAIASGFVADRSGLALMSPMDRIAGEANIDNRASLDKIKRLEIERGKEAEGSPERRAIQKQIADESVTIVNRRAKAIMDLQDAEEEQRRESERAYTEFNDQQRAIVEAYEDRLVAERKIRDEKRASLEEERADILDRMKPDTSAGMVFGSRQISSFNRSLFTSGASVSEGGTLRSIDNTNKAMLKKLADIEGKISMLGVMN